MKVAILVGSHLLVAVFALVAGCNLRFQKKEIPLQYSGSHFFTQMNEAKKEWEAEDYAYLSQIHFRDNQFEKALGAINTAILQNPYCAVYHLMKVDILYQMHVAFEETEREEQEFKATMQKPEQAKVLKEFLRQYYKGQFELIATKNGDKQSFTLKPKQEK